MSAKSLARLAIRLGLDKALRCGRGLKREELPPSVLAGAVEAVLGAVFLDGGSRRDPDRAVGLEEALEDELAVRAESNWKSILQELTQQAERVTPTYAVVSSEAGPDHQKEFVIAVLVDGVERGRGTGASKKAAEQAAAQAALLAMRTSAPRLAPS